ncbi:hypothetical protein ACPB8Q_03035 [Methanocaldococcus indicus]|uniref:hypothetical protein n=1 Tax=Methanocaldococcus indicus TaxID=213231 RepID=UPI003C6D9E31
MRIYRISGLTFILFILVFLAILIVLFILFLPLFIIIFLIILIIILSFIFKKKIKNFIRNLRKKKIKIEYIDSKGDISIHFPKRIPIENEEANSNIINIDENLKPFILYLKKKGLEIKEDGYYFKGYKVYPIYKKSYPLNEIIKLEYPEDIDAVILGLKGEVYEPKFLYLIPKEFLKNRMSLDEIKRFKIDL